jgi:hypothetical protein
MNFNFILYFRFLQRWVGSSVFWNINSVVLTGNTFFIANYIIILITQIFVINYTELSHSKQITFLEWRLFCLSAYGLFADTSSISEYSVQ